MGPLKREGVICRPQQPPSPLTSLLSGILKSFARLESTGDSQSAPSGTWQNERVGWSWHVVPQGSLA